MTGFYEELSVVLEELYHRFKKAQSEAAYNEQQQKTQQSSLLQVICYFPNTESKMF